MISDRDSDRILRAWFQEPAAPLPDRILDVVADGLPKVRQRRRAWSPPNVGFRPRLVVPIAIVALAILALLAGLLLAGGRVPVAPSSRAFATSDEPLAPGRYVIDSPFVTRLGVDIPGGWLGLEHGPAWTLLVRDEPGQQGGLVITFVDAVYVNPCRPELGLLETLGPSADDLALALRRLPGVTTSEISHPLVGARPAAALTLQAPDSFAGCTAGDPTFPLWALPETYAMSEGERHRFWILDVGGRRLVLAGRDQGPSSTAAADLDAMVASIDLTPDPAGEPAPTRTEAPPGPPMATLPARGQVSAGGYVFLVPVYAAGPNGALTRLSGPHDAALEVPAGWFATSRGLTASLEPHSVASLSVWTVAAVHLDPCRWRTGGLGTPDPAMMLDVASLAQAFSAWWPPNPEPLLTTSGYSPPPHAPQAGTPIFVERNGHPARSQALEVPADLDLAGCDDGEYRIWEDPEGVVRTAQSGERIQLWIVDLEPGIVVVDVAQRPGASPARIDDLAAMIESLWIGVAGSE